MFIFFANLHKTSHRYNQQSGRKCEAESPIPGDGCGVELVEQDAPDKDSQQSGKVDKWE